MENDYQTAIKLAWEKFNDDKFTETKEDCLKMIKHYPEKANCHYLLGHVYFVNEDYRKAADNFLISLQKDESHINDGYAYFWLGEAFSKQDWNHEDDNKFFIYDKDKSEMYYKLAIQSKVFPEHALLHFQYSVNGKEKIDLLEKGISHFPNIPDFYILLSDHYKSQGMSESQLNSLKRATENKIESSSLSYNLGLYFYSKGDFKIADEYFAQALQLNNNKNYNFAINYYLGICNDKVGNKSAAEEFFRNAYVSELNSPDSLFGFFGLLGVYFDLDDHKKIGDLILNLNITADLISEENPTSGRPIFLADHAIDHIEIMNFAEILNKLAKLKLNRAESILIGKTWVLRYFVTAQLQKYQDQYKAIKNALKFLTHSQYDFLYTLYGEALSNLIYYKADTQNERNRLYDNIILDLENWNVLSNYIESYIEKLFNILFEDKNYQKIIDLSKFFSLSKLSEFKVLFKLGYSYAALNQNVKAEEIYQCEIQNNGKTAAVLNNLGNLFDSRGDHTGAIELYKQGLLIDNKDDTLNSNIQKSKKKLALADKKAAQEKSLLQEYQMAINLLSKENDFVLDKLSQFIERIKTDPEFDDWRLPIPRFNFPKYLEVSKQIADSLLTQWLKKQYLVDTKSRDDYNVIIYAINPYIEKEILRLKKHKIPNHWVNSFVTLSADTLESKGYFKLLSSVETLDEKYKLLFERDIDELFFNYLFNKQKATIVISGSLIELALIYHCESNGLSTIAVQEGTKVKNKPLYSTVLNELITFAEQQKLFGQDFTHLSNLSRIYRNFVHPGKELKEGLNNSKVELCFISTIEILKRIL